MTLGIDKRQRTKGPLSNVSEPQSIPMICILQNIQVTTKFRKRQMLLVGCKYDQ